MTTIATDGKVMVGDGRTSDASEMIVGNSAVKVERLADGSIMGFAGRSREQSLFRQWYNTDQSDDLKAADFAAILLRPDGRVQFYDCGREPIDCPVPMAIGSGKKYAMGAMAAGLDPRRAVEIAARFDPWTGGDIIALRLDGE